VKISTLVFSIILVYLIIVVYMYFNQRNLLYLPSENNYLDDQIEFDYQEVFIETENNLKLKSWIIEKDFLNKNTLVFFHGNAGNLSNRNYKLNQLNKLDINIIILAWRSFSGNKGEPTEQNLYNDAKKTIEWLNTKGVKNKNIILYGESLGTGVAVELGQMNKFRAIILESPFTSMTNAAKNIYPWLPVKYLLKDKYDSEKKIKNLKIPILIMHGKKDSIVPFRMGKKLYDLANDPKFSYFTENDDHMMTFDEQLVNAIKNFLIFNSQ
tara:strand:+ start:1213 stop:2016 length:804 start_codon:yes stop_codon:yes gene_type:complete